MPTTNTPAVTGQNRNLLLNITPDIGAMGNWLGGMANTVLSTALAAVKMQEEARKQESEAAGLPFTPFTDLETEAVVLGNALQFTNATDYFSHLTRFQIVKRVRDGGLSTVHPSHYDTVEAFAEEHGMSSSEYYDMMSLFEWIFPWLQNNMRDDNGEPMDPSDIWMKIGKSKLRQLIPYFRVALDVPGLSGEEWRDRDTQTLSRLEENVAADELGIHLPTLMANPREYAAAQTRIRAHVATWDAATRPTRLANFLLRAGLENARFDDLRRRLRPQADNQPTVSMIKKGNQKYMLVPVGENQVAAIMQKFRDYQIDDIDLDAENAAALIDRVPVLTSIRDLLNIE